ncbi:MFS transporter [Saccharopolyspora hirsuta]|uniref:MFS transporter n=1 Tax=Saccharopolyspora hirsuta TaxID=1837 RepID=A0A5M7BF74_SACHI|nr:MFS transporter [Saccharopolyspora hirsuta]KAA5827127.1 MFS transporter [Saccharopolyspora hirsuta]
MSTAPDAVGVAPPAAHACSASRISLIVAVVAFVTTLDNTIIAAAAPSIGRELGLELSTLQWVSVAYMLPYGGLLLGAGALIDQWGRRRALLVACALFAAGALCGGVARSAELLIAARVLQGTAAAFLVPGTLSLIRTELPGSERARAIAVWTASLAAALALGPWLGGALAEHAHWSWIFLCNIPFLAVAGGLLARTAELVHRRPGAPGRVGSAVLVTLGLVLLTASAAASWESGACQLVAAGLGVTGLVVFAVREHRSRTPLVPAALRSNRVFLGANALILLWGLGISGIVFFTPAVFQESLGLAPQAAGLPLVVVAVAVVGATPLVPAATRALGAHRAVFLGLLALSAGLLQLAAVNDETSMAPRIAGLVLAGIGSAFTAPITGRALDLIGAQESGAASGALTASRELSSAFGVVLIGFVLTAVQAAEVGGGAPRGPALASGYAAALVVAASLQAAGAVLALVVLRARRAGGSTSAENCEGA